MSNKYIRTKNGIYRTTKNFVVGKEHYVAWHDFYEEIIKQAETIEELCDMFVVWEGSGLLTIIDYENAHMRHIKEMANRLTIYGAIWTDKGLIYVAKMKGILPNGEIDWKLL